MLDKLGYPEAEHPEILRILTESAERRDMQICVKRCCKYGKHEQNRMAINIEQANGMGAVMKLSVERDGSVLCLVDGHSAQQRGNLPQLWRAVLHFV